MESLALRHPEVVAHAAVASPAIERELRKLLARDAAERIVWNDLSLARVSNLLLSPFDRLFPARRLARLRTNDALFESVRMIVSTERTCLRVRRRLRKRMGEAAPLFAYVPHGSGDRNVAYHPELAQFDVKLVSGQKLIDEMVARGIARPEQCHLIGYPKFDAVDVTRRERFFENDRPTFVYNPHFDPVLSSWYDHGPALLRRFAALEGQYNLIFAPHVMLFRKTLHASPEYRTARRRPEIPQEALSAKNILIDTDSERLFDMSYTLSADGYIGDMSSQVYEFLLRRRPVFFIDTHSADRPEEAPNRAFWANGPVVTSLDELFEFLPNHDRIGEEYRDAQDRLFSYTIDDQPGRRSVDRAADILDQIART